jgi:hypothetical protein
MSIKSVREITYFKTLRDREINLSFCNLGQNKTKEELCYFVGYLTMLAKEEKERSEQIQLAHMEKDCITALTQKLEKQLNESSGDVKLTFIETVHLHSILDYFENNFDGFRSYIKNKNIPHHLTPFILAPSNYYNTIFNLKNRIEYKLGELVVNSYKFKHK